MKGRKPTPKHLALVRGNPGKREIPEAIPEPESLYMPAPAFLDDAARAEWERLIPDLVRWGLFSAMDLGPLAGYCAMHASFVKAKAACDAEGDTYETEGKHGVMRRVRPEFMVMAEALRQMRMIGSEFGLTPAARTRLKGAAQGDLFGPQPADEPKKKTASPWDAL